MPRQGFSLPRHAQAWQAIEIVVYGYYIVNMKVLMIAQSLALSPLYRRMKAEDQVELILQLRDHKDFQVCSMKDRIAKWIRTGEY